MDTQEPSALAFVDTETTGLNPYFHEVWEFGIIIDGEEHRWAVEPNLRKADPKALQVCRYYERRPDIIFDDPGHVAVMVASCLANRRIVGIAPYFDAFFIEPFLRKNGHSPAWHHQLIDIEALIAGRLGLAPVWKSHQLSQLIGINPDDFERHTALGDANWHEALYNRVMFETDQIPALDPESVGATFTKVEIAAGGLPVN